MSAWTEPAFARVARLVAAETGMRDLAHRVGIEDAIRRAMRRAQVADAAQFAGQLEGGELPLDDLIAELTVGESYFFRDPDLFAVIRTTVIPALLAARPASPLRIWSAGCAGGEEAYSLAMLLSDMGVAGHVLATDVSRAALERARSGRYRPWSLRGLESPVVERAFHRRGGEWEVDQRFRPHVTFEIHNLATGTLPAAAAGGVDLVLCRNVLIYLDGDVVRRVTTALAAALVEGGWLITAPSDPPLHEVSNLHAVLTPAGVVYRKESAGSELRFPMAASVVPAVTASLVADPPERAVRARREAGLQAASAYDADAVHRLRALADREGPAVALRECLDLAQRWPLSPELHYLHAVLRLALNQLDDAAAAVRRVLYLDRSIAVAHLMLAIILRQQGRYDEARRSYVTAHALTASRPPDECPPLADGETVASIARVASAEIAWLDARQRTAS